MSHPASPYSTGLLIALAVATIASSWYVRTAPAELAAAQTAGGAALAQVEALAHHDHPRPNAGIWTAFHAASPANRRVTGPYGRFLNMIKNPANRDFLGSRSARVIHESVDGAAAVVTLEIVTRDGRPVPYSFGLSNHASRGWLTDGVERVAR